MALGKRSSKQPDLFVTSTQIVKGPAHPFYSKLNGVLQEAGFDDFVERLCAEYYKKGGRPGIPPGVYLRMVLIGYFEGLDSQRGIAWRCAQRCGVQENSNPQGRRVARGRKVLGFIGVAGS